MIILPKGKNNVSSALGLAHSAGSATLTLATGGGATFPAPSTTDPIYVTVAATDGLTWNIYKVESSSGDSLTVATVLDSSAGGIADQSYVVGDTVEIRMTWQHLSDAYAAIRGLDGQLAGLSTSSSPQFSGLSLSGIGGPSILKLNFDHTISAATPNTDYAPPFNTQVPHRVLAGPSSGIVSSSPNFRLLVAEDIPDLSSVYHTDTTATSWLATRSTADLPEGSNLYHTNARVNTLITSAIGVSVQSHSSVLDTLAGSTYTSGNLLGGDGSGIPTPIVVGSGLSLAGGTISATGGGGSGAGTGNPFLTFGVSAELTDERVLTEGTGVSMADSGTDGGSLTISIGQAVGTTDSPSFTNITAAGKIYAENFFKSTNGYFWNGDETTGLLLSSRATVLQGTAGFDGTTATVNIVRSATASANADTKLLSIRNGDAEVAYWKTGGGYTPAKLADTDAPNDSFYYSSTQSSLAYKDGSGSIVAIGGTGSGGSGTVTSVSVVSANGVSGSVATDTTTPAITLTLGDITPNSVVATGTISGSNLSGSNTGDQTVVMSGDVSGTGTGAITTTIGAGKVTPTMLAGEIPATLLVGTDLVVTQSQVTSLESDLIAISSDIATKADQTEVDSLTTTVGTKAPIASPTFSGTTTIGGLSGLLKGTSGAVSVAAAGTDYLAPNGDGSALTGTKAPWQIAFILGADTDLVANDTTSTVRRINKAHTLISCWVAATTAPVGTDAIFTVEKSTDHGGTWTDLWSGTTANRPVILADTSEGQAGAFDATAGEAGTWYRARVIQVGGTTPGKDVTLELEVR